MSDHDVDQLDDRATRAAADLRARAAERPRPRFEPDRSPTRHLLVDPRRSTSTIRPFLAAAAALVLVVGAVGWWAAGIDDTRPDPTDVATTAGEPRPFAATDLPDDLGFAGAAELDGEPSPAPGQLHDREGRATLVVYGPEPSQPGLGVVVLDGADVRGDSDAEAVDVPGAEAYATSAPGPENLAVVQDERTVYLISPTLDRAALVRAATGVTIEGDRPVLAEGAVPDGWRHLGDTDAMPQVAPVGGFLSLSPSGSGNVVSYVAGPDRMVMVTSRAGNAIDQEAPRLFGARVDEIDLGGRPALVVTYPERAEWRGSPERVVTWFEEPGELVRVAAMGLTADEALTVAEGVEPLGPEAWNDLLRRTRLGELDGDLPYGGPGTEVVEVERGTLPDGTAWVLRVQEHRGTIFPDLTVDLPPDAGSSSGSSSGGSLYATTQVSRADRLFAAGLVSDTVAAVELRSGSGDAVTRVEPVEGGGYRGWVTEYHDTLTVVAFDADGAEIGRTQLAPDGHVSDEVTPTTTG